MNDFENTLGQFRSTELAGGHILAEVERLSESIPLVNAAVGVGKSHSIDNVIEDALSSGKHDLAIVLAPTHGILQERRLLKEQSPYEVAYLVSRPGRTCGAKRDALWKNYEQRGLGILGKREICASCSSRESCEWPSQLGQGLKGKQVVFATQSYIACIPTFVNMVKESCGASRPFVLFDEINFVNQSFRRKVLRDDLKMHLGVLRHMLALSAPDDGQISRHLYYVETLLLAGQSDLGGQWDIPGLSLDIHSRIQQTGVQLYPQDYSFIAFDLELFRFSVPASRQLNSNGDLEFFVRPWLGSSAVIYSGTAWPELLTHRLANTVTPLYPVNCIKHPESKWYNIASKIGMLSYFNKNSDQVVEFITQLVLRRQAEGKKVLLVCRKKFRDMCRQKIGQRISTANGGLSVAFAEDWLQLSPSDKGTAIPLLHYGMIGVNSFSDFDAAYCVTGYYVPEDVVQGLFQEMYPSTRQIPIKIVTDGAPLRRKVVPEDPGDGIYSEFLRLGQHALEQEELGVVVQAVGRVRPFTKPREVITFQCGQVPGVDYEAEFNNLDEARRYFGIQKERERKLLDLKSKILSFKNAGCTQVATAETLKISERTVIRHWRG